MKHYIQAIDANNYIIAEKEFETAEQAYECQVDWVENKIIKGAVLVARYNDGYIMTVMDVNQD